ncbi:uncharacterized protein LOC128201167 [Galleria mellonella]|uniref:Uncharacterized protein LOC128201167 n=1 Tax=Galleria mellonella TaxID=7137 RepID=A0ABM3MPH9_GALME|nr:uncharacterized protein LOC128201167 [Galleria mellonella]
MILMSVFPLTFLQLVYNIGFSYMNKEIMNSQKEDNKSESEDYEEDSKGFPVRRKRNNSKTDTSDLSKANLTVSKVSSSLKIGKNDNKNFLDTVFADKLLIISKTNRTNKQLNVEVEDTSGIIFTKKIIHKFNYLD